MVGRSDKPTPRITAALRTFAVNAGPEVPDMTAVHADVVIAVVRVPEPVQGGIVAHAPTLSVFTYTPSHNSGFAALAARSASYTLDGSPLLMWRRISP